LDRSLPDDAPRVEAALLLGVAQILFLNVPDHAAVDLSVRLIAKERGGRYAGFVNAILRKIAREGKAQLSKVEAQTSNAPEWLFARWRETYGEETARKIDARHTVEPALDLSVKSDAKGWAEKFGGVVLPTGTVRFISHGTVPAL